MTTPRGFKLRSVSGTDYIYIHGTPEENKIGTPASFGCVRMRSRDVVQLFDTVGRGARVTIDTAPLPPAVPTPPGPATGEQLAQGESTAAAAPAM